MGSVRPAKNALSVFCRKEIRRAAPLGTRGEHRPDTLTPGATSLAARPLGDFAIDHDEAGHWISSTPMASMPISTTSTKCCRIVRCSSCRLSQQVSHTGPAFDELAGGHSLLRGRSLLLSKSLELIAQQATYLVPLTGSQRPSATAKEPLEGCEV